MATIDQGKSPRTASSSADNSAENNSQSSPLPDYLPARMLNEFVYCPRLFYYEWVDGVFAHNRETVEGELRHGKIDARSDAMPPAEELTDENRLHSRSVTLSSDTYGLIAKMDLIEASGGLVTPVDYKRGAPYRGDDGLPMVWDTDRVQLAVQALVLRDNGYNCEEGVIYYMKTKQRVRVAIDDAVVTETLDAMKAARDLAESGTIPSPLEDSRKCPRCSLVGICLPDETFSCENTPKQESVQRQLTLFEIGLPPEISANGSRDYGNVRRLVPARDDLRPLYLNTPGLRVGISSGVLKVKEKNKVVQEVRIGEICQLNLMGNIQITTQAVQQLCRREVPIAYFSMGGWFYGTTQGMGLKNVFLRKEQFKYADRPSFCISFARALVSGKIRNQRTMLQRNHIEPPRSAVNLMKCMYEEAERADSLETLLGIEGTAARLYFQHLSGMIKVGPNDEKPETGPEENGNSTLSFTFDFNGRNRRPPRDPVNALLSLAYSLLAKDLTFTCHAVGFDPFWGFYHQPRFGRASLALDLMEPFRPLIADSAVLSAINTRMVTEKDFIKAGQSTALTPDGRKAFFRAYEQRMDSLVTHPLFGYRVSYRRLLEIQARLLARVLTGELHTYPVFVTR
ncbi:MAG: CRISPR-associated endonuclease Cas1 [Planctomycetaceae bacterium]